VDAPLLASIGHYVTHWAHVHPDRDAAIGDGERVSWHELCARVEGTAAALLAHGVSRGDRVSVLAEPSPRFLEVYLAVVSVGGVFHGLNPRSTVDELRYQLADAAPRLVIDLFRQDDRIAQAGAETIADPTAHAVVDRAALDRARAAVQSRDPCILVYTSGSTGRPKGALITHRGLAHCSVVQADHWYDDDVRFLCNLPVNHLGCLGDIVASTVVAGGTLVFQRRFDPIGVLDLIVEQRVRYWGAVPAMFALTLQTEAWARADLSGLHRIIWGGGAMPVSLARHLAERCPRVSNSYGMTETSGSVTYTADDDDLETICTTIGRPDSRFEVRIWRPDGSACVAGEEGELVVRGDCVMHGYLNRPDATAKTVGADGWLHTGDLAVQRPDGNLVLAGRMTDMFKSGGYNVYPREVELALEDHPGVRLAAVIGVPDSVYGEVGLAFVIPANGPVDPEELRRYLRARVANYKIPKRIEVTGDLPLLPVGKIDRVALRATLGLSR
jgi:acyl-CoA synthetase (AMP-forming)/AMP-acid ligase II